MKNKSFSPACLVLIFLISGFLLASCTPGNSQSQPPGYQETLVQIQVQQTLLAQEQKGSLESTIMVQQATLEAQSEQATQLAIPPIGTATVDQAPFIEQTVQAGQLTQQALLPLPPAPEITATSEPVESVDFETWMKTANILLYEDMVTLPETNRYVKDTLKWMGLPFKDDGNAQGWLKSDILSGAPNGDPWDLVIIAAEAKSAVSGEFFEYISDVFDQGASLILELWYLDQIAAGSASTLLYQCGVEFESDWSKVPPSRMVMFTLDPSHPVMREPNSALSFTKVTSFWWDETMEITYDIGDKIRLIPGGGASLLVGTIATEKNTHGTVAVCLDDRMILQTFSSHQLSYDAMQPVWENYIYQMLKSRFLSNQ